MNIATIVLLGLIAVLGAKRLRDWQDFAIVQRRAISLIPAAQTIGTAPERRHSQQETFISLPPRYVSPEQHRNQLRHASRSYAARRSSKWCSSQSQRT